MWKDVGKMTLFEIVPVSCRKLSRTLRLFPEKGRWQALEPGSRSSSLIVSLARR